MKLGERIRQIRIHRGMTQGELVKGICSITYLSRIENGQVKPSPSFLEKVSKKLDIDVNHLMKTNTEGIEEKIAEIAMKYKQTKELTESDAALLELHAREMHSIPILLQIFGVLIHYYVHLRSVNRAKVIYNQSVNLIPSRPNNSFPDDFLYYYIACGNYFYCIQDFIKANKHYVQADKLLHAENSLQRADLYYNMSLAKQRIFKNQSVSRTYSQKAYEIYKELNLPLNIAEVLNTIAVQYHLDGKYEDSLQCLKSAEHYVKDFENPVLEAMLEYNYGRVLQGLENYDQAIQRFNKAIQINSSINREMQKIYSLRSLIQIYLHLKDWEQVDQLMSQALTIVQAYDLPSLYTELHMYQARIFKIRGDYYSYEKTMQKAVDFGVEKKQYRLAKDLANELGEYFYEIRAYKLAAKHFKTALSCVIETDS